MGFSLAEMSVVWCKFSELFVFGRRASKWQTIYAGILIGGCSVSSLHVVKARDWDWMTLKVHPNPKNILWFHDSLMKTNFAHSINEDQHKLQLNLALCSRRGFFCLRFCAPPGSWQQSLPPYEGCWEDLAALPSGQAGSGSQRRHPKPEVRGAGVGREWLPLTLLPGTGRIPAPTRVTAPQLPARRRSCALQEQSGREASYTCSSWFWLIDLSRQTGRWPYRHFLWWRRKCSSSFPAWAMGTDQIREMTQRSWLKTPLHLFSPLLSQEGNSAKKHFRKRTSGWDDDWGY